MIAIQIPLTIMTILATVTLFIVIYITWVIGFVPRFSLPLFWVFNIGGFFFLANGFKEDIMPMAKDGAFIIFVSYVLLANFIIYQIDLSNNNRSKNEKK